MLRDAGCDVEVYERSEAPLQDRGAGIVLHPATIRYLTENSIRTASEIGVPAHWLRYLARDDSIASEDPCGFRSTSYNALYRGLLGRFDANRYHLGHQVVDFDAARGGVEVRLVGGDTTRCDLLVLCRRRPVLRARPATAAGLVALCRVRRLARCRRPLGAGTGALAALDQATRSASVPPGFVQERHVAELVSTDRDALPGRFAELIARTAEPAVQAGSASTPRG